MTRAGTGKRYSLVENSMSTKRVRKKREQLWGIDPHCYWCGIETKLVFRRGGYHKKNEAVISHIYIRYSPLRTAIPRGEKRLVLSCWECDNTRSSLLTAEQPIENLWKRANCWPQDHPFSKNNFERS